MTFKLSNLSALREHFDDTKDIIFIRDKKGKIEDLTNPQRKSEFQFLESILAKLEEQAKDKTQTPLVNGPSVFYGAMLTIVQDIENNRRTGESPGLLSERLKDLLKMGSDVKADEKPDLYQTAAFHTNLNVFLNQIFIENDSRKGFAKNHMLSGVPTDSLNKIMQTAYKLERDAQKETTSSFVADTKSDVEFAKYRFAKRSPESAVERFGGWEKLNADLDALGKDEFADKNKPKIENLSKERVVQLHFLNAVRNSLKTSSIEKQERTAILAGAMHLVRQQIINEYLSSYVVKNPENSTIYRGLNKILGVGEVSQQDTEALVSSASQFVQFVTVDSKSSGKKSIRTNHIFSSIADFNLKATFNLFFDMIHTCRVESLTKVIEEFKKETQSHDKAGKGYLEGISSAFGFFRAKKKDDEDEYDVLEHKTPHSKVG